jgi:hypothetical protein
MHLKLKKMRTMLIPLFFLAVMLGKANAQDSLNVSSEEIIDAQVRKLTRVLELNVTAQVAVENALTKRLNFIKDKHNKNELSLKDLHKINYDLFQDLKSFLSGAQFERLSSLRENIGRQKAYHNFKENKNQSLEKNIPLNEDILLDILSM